VARYAVLPAPGRVVVRERPVPEPPPEGAVLAVEVCGVCGTDVELFDGDLEGTAFPVVPGHEPVGRIHSIRPEAARRWGVAEGDRVAMLSTLRCGRCDGCRLGRSCADVGPGLPNYGFRPPDEHGGMWGGFGTHLTLPSTASFVPMSESVPLPAASLFNALANGYEWTVEVGGVAAGDRVVVFGPGPRGLACVVAARDAGAGFVGVVGLAGDADRLAAASSLGADATVVVGGRPVAEQVVDAFGSEADVVIDATPRSLDVPDACVRVARRGATVVLAGLKGRGRTAPLPVDLVVDRQLSLRGAPSKGRAATAAAVARLERGDAAVTSMATHGYGLDRLEEAIGVAAGRTTVGGVRALHVRVEP
jgi:threonine dehydrogenase-like Zn-dependent dehydrogenase